MRKLIYSALATGAALAVAFGAGAVNVSAEETAAPAATVEKSVLKDATYDIEGDTLMITGSDASKILVGTAKWDKKNSKYTSSAWDVYDNSDIVKVDLSKVSKTKDAFLQVKADFETDAQAYTLRVPASETIKGVVDKETGKVTVQKKNRDEYKGAVNFRTESQFNVQPLDNLDVATYQQTGGTIYLSTAVVALTQDKDNLVNADYVLPQRASKEVKVSIGKLANAPKVKANYATAEITIPKGTDYMAYMKGEAVPTTKSAIKDPVTLKVGTDVNATDNFAVDVQTRANAEKKKPASKWGHNVFVAQKETTISTEGYKEEVAKGKTTVTFENTSKDSYLVLWWAEGKTDISTADLVKKNTKKTTVKAGATAKLAGIATGAGIALQRVGTKTDWAGTIVSYKEGPNVAGYAAGGTAPSGGSTEPTPAPTYTITTDGRYAAALTVVASAQVGTTVTVTDTASVTDARSGNLLYTVTYGDSNTQIATSAITISEDGKSFSFTMPAGNVKIADA